MDWHDHWTQRKQERRNEMGDTIKSRRTAMLDLLESAPEKDGDQQILYHGNMKLGERKGIWHMSLLPLTTCPGASNGDTGCALKCYAYSLTEYRKHVAEAWARLTREALEDTEGFFERLQGEISRKRSLEVVRLHESGDCFNEAYIQGWIETAELFPELTFFGYTASWRIPNLLPALEEFRALDNVHLFASVQEHQKAYAREVIPDWRWATIVPSDHPAGWQEQDGRDALVCPNQVAGKNGDGKPKVTCADCRFCFTNREGSVLFREH